MKITVATLNDEIFVLDVNEDMELMNFKAFCEVETGIPANDLLISHNGSPLTNGETSLKSYGIVDNDVVILQKIFGNSVQQPTRSTSVAIPNVDFSSIQIPASVLAAPAERNISFLRNLYLSNPQQMADLKQKNPQLADAIASGDNAKLLNVLNEQRAARDRREAQRKQMLSSDPMHVDAQRMIENEIQQSNIEANMSAALEYTPETYGTIIMLYINCQVNGHPVQAFVDSGAQTTIISTGCAERCNIMRLVDKRFNGVAKGVGVQYIVGRVHMVQLQIENDFLATSFTVLGDQTVDVLLGLDMLRRYECCIDLNKNVLRIGTTGTETRFLSESEVPEFGKLGRDSAKILTDDERKVIEAASARYRKQNHQLFGESSSSSDLVSDDEIKPTDKFTENEVAEIITLGFTRTEVVKELRRFNGDKTQAMAALFAKSFKF